MKPPLLLAADGPSPFTPLISFLVFFGLCLLVCVLVGVDSDRAADFSVADRSLPAWRNALALCGDSIPATALLGPIGTVALSGYDGMVVSACAGAAMVVLLVFAERLRNTGRFTLGSILATRVGGTTARVAGAVVTLVVCLPLTVVQLVVAGKATAYVVGLKGPGVAQVCMVLIGLMVVTFVALGGMRGITVIQVVKALLVLVVVVAVAALAARQFGWDLGALVDRAGAGVGPRRYDAPGLLFGTGAQGTLELFSLCLTVALGSAGMPPVLLRVGASLDGRSARRASGYAALMITGFYAVGVLLGLAAAALVGARAIVADDPQGNSALFLLTTRLAQGADGPLVFTAVACAAFVTALAALTGLILAAATSLSHDLYAGVLRRERATGRQELAVVRWAVVAFGLGSVLLAVLLQGWSILFLASFAAAVAASVILPALAYTLFWPGFSRSGMLWTLYGSTLCCLVLQFFGPTVSGRPYSLFPHADFHWFPLQNIALVTVPLGFLLGWAGSRFAPRTTAERADDAAVELALLVGAGPGR